MKTTVKESTLRSWARLGQRGVYGQSILDLANTHDDLYAVSADLGNSSGLDRFKRQYPERYLNIGIAEQHMIGFASGLASTEKNVFVSSFAPFITLRAGEQVRMNLSYMQNNVKIVAIGSGISMGYLGNSHFGLEDISIIRSMPNIPIYCPADCFDVYQICNHLAQLKGPAYLRLTGGAPCKKVYSSDYVLDAEKWSSFGDGQTLLVMTYGSIASNVLEAANSYLSDTVTVAVLPRVHPLPEGILSYIAGFQGVLVVEEHSRIGGLTSSLSDIIATDDIATGKRLRGLTLPASYLTSGTYEDLLTRYGLDVSGIQEELAKMLDMITKESA